VALSAKRHVHLSPANQRVAVFISSPESKMGAGLAQFANSSQLFDTFAKGN
jgi:hypothetical protein